VQVQVDYYKGPMEQLAFLASEIQDTATLADIVEKTFRPMIVALPHLSQPQFRTGSVPDENLSLKRPRASRPACAWYDQLEILPPSDEPTTIVEPTFEHAGGSFTDLIPTLPPVPAARSVKTRRVSGMLHAADLIAIIPRDFEINYEVLGPSIATGATLSSQASASVLFTFGTPCGGVVLLLLTFLA